MIERARAAPWRERIVLVPAGREWLIVFLAEPLRADGPTVLFLQGSWHVPASNQNNIWTRLCRELTWRGHTTVRLDYHGVGESTGVLARTDETVPLVADVEAVMGWLRRRGNRRFVLVGSCFGGQVAAATAARADDVVGVAMLTPRLHDGPDVAALLEAVGTLHARGIGSLLVYGRSDSYYQLLEAELGGTEMASRRLAALGCQLQVLPGDVRGFLQIRAQRQVEAELPRWLADLQAATASQRQPWTSP